ncbi:MAG: hypothetical protein KUG68_08610 [Flavobacteriaceae bacterium]|nr:hypothetical protein [Flavobacteriaceae bacterium]
MGAIQKEEISFYQSLGKLFYAIAASDKIVRVAEYDALRKIVTKAWKPLDDFEDEFHTDAALQIEIVFDWLDYKSLKAIDCFKEFASFKKENEYLFSSKRKNLIWETANAIANSFSGKNKSELIMLAKLKMVLEK